MRWGKSRHSQAWALPAGRMECCAVALLVFPQPSTVLDTAIASYHDVRRKVREQTQKYAADTQL